MSPHAYNRLAQDTHSCLRRYEDAAYLLEQQLSAVENYPDLTALILEVINEHPFKEMA